MNHPIVSIIIPVYNVEDYIKMTLESILTQTFQNFEIILIDDESTDNSKAIMMEYAKKYSNINVYSQKNSGPSRARNKGISYATGTYIAFVDSDDLLPENSLEVRVKAAIEQNADIIIGQTNKFNSEREWAMPTHNLGEGEKDIAYDGSILWTVGPCNKLFKRELIKDLKFPENITYAEDQVFVIEAYLRSAKIYAIDDMIYLYRMRETTTNTSLTQQQTKNSARVLQQLVEVWGTILEYVDTHVEDIYAARNIKIRYLERMVSADLWPTLKSALVSRDKEQQAIMLEVCKKILDMTDSDVINRQVKLKWVMSKGIIDKYLFIDKSNRKATNELFSLLFSKLDANSVYQLRREHGYFMKYLKAQENAKTSLPIYQFLIHRRIKMLPAQLKAKSKKRKAEQDKKREQRRKKREQQLLRLVSETTFKYAKKLPMQKNTVILATNRSAVLEGNLKYIHNELLKHPEIEVKLYLNNPHRKKLETYQMYVDFATAKYIIVDDYYRQLYGYELNEKTEMIQVWHASGAFKRFGLSSIGMGDSNSEVFERRAHGHYTTVVTSSSEINEHYAEAFGVAIDKVKPLGVPRADILLNDAYKSYMVEKLTYKFPQIRNKKVILYAPTFRGKPQTRRQFKLELDYKTILDTLGEDYVIVLKLHPIVNKSSVKVDAEYQDRVLNLTDYKDINELMLVSDVLISDYSSVAFEYSLLNRPMVFFAYDLDCYLDERNFYYNYEEFVPGPVVKTNEELIDVLKNEKYDLKQVEAFKHKFFEDVDGKSAQRIVEYMLSK